MPALPFACRHRVSALLIPLVIAGCTTWRVARVEPRTLVEQVRPSLVRVVTRAGDRVEIADPYIAKDSILGRVSSWEKPTGPPVEPWQMNRGVPLDDVARIETGEENPIGPLALGLAGIGLILVIVGGLTL